MRDAFLSAADTARVLLDQPDLLERWDTPSVLEEMTMGALTAHLARAVTVLPGYLEHQVAPPFRDAPDYFLNLFPKPDTDPNSEMALSVRSRAETDAGDGLQRITAAWDDARARLETGLDRDHLEIGIAVRGCSMRVHDYLITRMVELVVHSDDMAASLDIPPPDFDAAVTEAVLSCLVEMARRRSSALDVIRAMTRVERADPGVLRVF